VGVRRGLSSPRLPFLRIRWNENGMKFEAESEDTHTKKSLIARKAFTSIGKRFFTVKRYSLVLACILMGIWCVGRVIEVLTGTAVFEPVLIYWMAFFIWVMLGLFVVGAAIQYTRNLGAGYKQFPVIIAWVFFGMLLAGTIYSAPGYRIATMNLFAVASGMVEPAQQSLLALFKSYPAAPVLPINVVTAKAANNALEISSLLPFVWDSAYLFGIFIWGLAYGTLLIMQRGVRVSKILHLTLSGAGVIVMMVLKVSSALTKERLVFLHAGAVAVLLWQVLLTYSCIRLAAVQKNGEAEKVTPVVLPPSGFKYAVFLLVILPILADIHNQFVLAAS
jgi:hypothetical protein